MITYGTSASAAPSRLPFAASHRPTQQQQQQQQQQKKKKKSSVVLEVFQRDREYLGERLRPLRDQLGRLFWLRNLEDPQSVSSSSLPKPPQFHHHPPGLCGMDLLIADIEALKVYANYLRNASRVWSVPLPEYYDPQRVADYFSCRPHVLVFRIFEVFLSFASAAIRWKTSTRFEFNRHGGNMDGISGSSEYYFAHLLKESMLNLGPTFIKVGQSLSTRPDIVGTEISKALSELHDKVPPFPRAVAMNIIKEELGCSVDNIFSYISDEPVAAASFGQVYRGCTLDGYSVAVKVQRPNLLHAVVRDIYIIRLGLQLLRKVARRKNDICLYADELGKGLVGELDYRLEAANASDFLEAHSMYSFISVPKVFRHLSKKRVLTMEWMVGENPNDLLLLSKGIVNQNTSYSQRQQLAARTCLLNLARKGVESTLVQLLETGLLHADPHPGNLRYTADGRIGFLDFGLLCRMEKKHCLAMLASIVHIVNGDWGALANDLILMDVVTPGTNIHQVKMDLEEGLGEVSLKDGIPDIKFSRVLGKIWSIAYKYQFSMPPYYTLVLRSLASLEGLAIAADQNFKTFQAAYPYVVHKLLHDNSSTTRQILYSVVFNKKREIQWKKISLLFRMGSIRDDANWLSNLSSEKPRVYRRNVQGEEYEMASLILRLLPSKNGFVLRRLLISADGASLARDMVSEEAAFFRRQVCRALADVICQWMLKVVKGGKTSYHYNQEDMDSGIPPSSYAPALQKAWRDRRLRIILYKILGYIRKDRILMLRVSFSCFIVLVVALPLALRSFLVYWWATCIKSISFIPQRLGLGQLAVN